jgi:hypothetical protein
MYPYARGGPWTYTPAGQGRDLFQMNMTDVVVRPATGWYRAPELLAELVPRGLPMGFHEASLASGSTSSGGQWRELVALAVLLSAVSVATVLSRRRRQGPLEAPASI